MHQPAKMFGSFVRYSESEPPYLPVKLCAHLYCTNLYKIKKKNNISIFERPYDTTHNTDFYRKS